MCEGSLCHGYSVSYLSCHREWWQEKIRVQPGWNFATTVLQSEWEAEEAPSPYCGVLRVMLVRLGKQHGDGSRRHGSGVGRRSGQLQRLDTSKYNNRGPVNRRHMYAVHVRTLCPEQGQGDCSSSRHSSCSSDYRIICLWQLFQWQRLVRRGWSALVHVETKSLKKRTYN